MTQVAAGNGFAAVLGSEGRVYTVGTNTYGELGIGPKCENEGGEMGYQGRLLQPRVDRRPGPRRRAGDLRRA